MASAKLVTFISSRRNSIFLISAFLILIGVAANGAGIINTPEAGYLLCIDSKTKLVSHPGTSKCPKGSKTLILGARGQEGATGLTGAAGLNGRDGKDGKTLWNGVTDPENTWGAPGDMFINSVTNKLFGPKNLDGTWPAGVSMIGPKGDQGPVGLTGATGPQGPGGPAGPTGAQGPAGPVGATGATGTAGVSAPRLYLWDDEGVKHEEVEFVGSWSENYYFKIDNRIWRMNNLGSVRGFFVYFRDDLCTAPAVYVTGWNSWDEFTPQPLLNAYFVNSYYADPNVYRITGPIITIPTIYSFDGTTCSPSYGSFEVLKATQLSGVATPSTFGRFTIGP